jgi:tripartite-type tricarboxylate transporter receptor subunit TctC
MMIATRSDAPYKTLGDVIAKAKAEPGKVSYSSAGIGTGHHLLGEWINAEGRVDMVHVPFKGGTSVLTDVMSGRIDIMIETMTLALSHVKSGKMRALAVTSPRPLDYLPGVPLATDTLPGVIYESWLGIFTSPGTPPAVIQRINTEMRAVLQKPEVVQRLADLGGSAMPSSPAELRARVVSDIDKWKRIVDSRNIERQ